MRTFCRDPLLTIANSKRALVATFLVTFAVGSLGYHWLEGYTFVQCMEWSAQTITSTGYGNYPAQSTGGSMFSTVLMLWSVPMLLSLVTAFFVSALRKDPNVFTDAEQEEILSYVREQREAWKRLQNPPEVWRP